MEAQVTKAPFLIQDLHHTRGNNFASINIGLLYGNGQTRPTRLDLGQFNNLEKALLKDEDIQRLASYQGGK